MFGFELNIVYDTYLFVDQNKFINITYYGFYCIRMTIEKYFELKNRPVNPRSNYSKSICFQQVMDLFSWLEDENKYFHYAFAYEKAKNDMVFINPDTFEKDYNYFNYYKVKVYLMIENENDFVLAKTLFFPSGKVYKEM